MPSKTGLKSSLYQLFRKHSPGIGLSRLFPFSREIAEWLGKPPLLQKDEIVTVQTHRTSFRMLLSKDDPTISPQIFNQQIWERYQTYLFEKEIHEHDVVLDIGAHLGYYSLLAGKLVGLTGKVLAFEPDPHNQLYLKENIRLNGLENIVTVFPYAAGNIDETRTLYRGKKGDTSDQSLGPITGAASTQQVEVKRVGDFLNQTVPDLYKRIRIIKMDIEGYEPFACAGMGDLLRHSKLILFTELNYRRLREAGGSAEKYLKLLQQYGFLIRVIRTSSHTLGASEKLYEGVDLKELGRERGNHLDLYCVKG